MHTKTPFATIFLHEVGALDDLQQDLSNNVARSSRLASQWRRILRHLAALIHLPYELLYESVSVCLQLDDLGCEINARLYDCLIFIWYAHCVRH